MVSSTLHLHQGSRPERLVGGFAMYVLASKLREPLVADFGIALVVAHANDGERRWCMAPVLRASPLD